MKNVYTVEKLNAYIKNMFSQDFLLRSIVVSGEASNVKYHSSGHIYFTLKDKNSAISCVMYDRYVNALTFKLTDGMQIEVSGSVNVYVKTGSYQVYATDIVSSGAGTLHEQYEKLKKELYDQGMFDARYKRPIPKYARKVGVVTSQTGAAIQDILRIARNRNPYVQIVLYPALVQGVGAKESIVAGINAFQNTDVDVIIVGRGGGSIEDLWAFNERCVAEAIFNSNIPIISAVGHEIDTTISDYVADWREPTPTAAAEKAIFSYEEFIKDIDNYRYKLNKLMDGRISQARYYVNHMQTRLDSLSPEAQIKFKRIKYINMISQLESIMQGIMDKKKNSLLVYIERMKALSPLDRLSHGYAYLTDSDGAKISDVNDVNVGDMLTLTMRNGYINAQALNKVVEEE